MVAGAATARLLEAARRRCATYLDSDERLAVRRSASGGTATDAARRARAEDARARLATHADGAHPYWTTPEHTAEARAILGPDKLLCVEQKVVLTTDAAAARAAASGAVRVYAGLPNYRNNWLRLGFSDDEIEQRDPRFIDALVAWGDADTVRSRVAGTLRRGRGPRVHPTAVGRGLRRQLDWSALEALAP